MTIRLHLDDTPACNGALSVIPSSHLSGKMSNEEVAKYSKERREVCECVAGDVLLMAPLILHSSLRSLEPKRRRVLHFEFARDSDLDPSLDWHEES